jgi:uncharacterized HAD superfamily protein
MARIFIDIDNIVTDFHNPFREYLNAATGKDLKVEDIKEFDFYRDFQVPKEQERTYHQEFKKKGGYGKLKPVVGYKEGIKCLQRYGEIKFITARSADLREETFRWFEKHKIPIKQDQIVFAQDKLTFASKYDILIEDKWEDSIQAAERGKDVVLFHYPWNNVRDMDGNVREHQNIRRVSDWKEAVEVIGKIIENKFKTPLDDRTYQIWKESIRVQMHFNELIMKNRTTAASWIVVALGAAFTLYKLGATVHVPEIEPITLGDIVAGLAFFGLLAYAALDIGYYFKLLIGSVEFTEKMELEYKALGLTSSITGSIKHRAACKALVLHYALLLVPILAYGLIRIFL